MQNTIAAGKNLKEAEKVLIMVHGRGGSPEDIMELASELNVSEYALIGPTATAGSWYPNSFLSPRSDNEPYLTRSLNQIHDLIVDLESQGFAKSQIYLLGFSQGACLILDFAASEAIRYGGIVAFTGGVIGDHLDHRNYRGDFDGTPVFIGSSNPDFHVPVERVNETAALYEGMGAQVTEIIYENMGHTISKSEINQVNKLIFF